jgi:hypothetical protein
MFPPLTARRSEKRSLRELLRGAADRPEQGSLRELLRGAVGTALEFATLGEATAQARHPRPAPPAPAAGSPRPAATAPIAEHPHRRQVGRIARRRRPGRVAPRAQVCVTPVHRPARRDPGGKAARPAA